MFLDGIWNVREERLGVTVEIVSTGGVAVTVSTTVCVTTLVAGSEDVLPPQAAVASTIAVRTPIRSTRAD